MMLIAVFNIFSSYEHEYLKMRINIIMSGRGFDLAKYHFPFQPIRFKFRALHAKHLKEGRTKHEIQNLQAFYKVRQKIYGAMN